MEDKMSEYVNAQKGKQMAPTFIVLGRYNPK